MPYHGSEYYQEILLLSLSFVKHLRLIFRVYVFYEFPSCIEHYCYGECCCRVGGYL
jgi:hypothetical protein